MAKWIPMLVFLGITFGGLLFYYAGGEENSGWDLYSALDTSSAVALSILALFGYYEFIRSEESVAIFFKTPEKREIDTGLSLLRKNFTRSELLGALGMIRKDSKEPFSIATLKKPSILHRLQEVQKGKSKRFVIHISNEELAQFDTGENV